MDAGKNRWSIVHVRDIGEIFLRLVEKAVKGENENLRNVDGMYLIGVEEVIIVPLCTFSALCLVSIQGPSVSWHDCYHSFDGIYKRVLAAAIEQRHIKNDYIEELGPDQSDALLPHGVAIYGTNAQGKGFKAKKILGWHPSKENYGNDIPMVVAEEAKSLGKA